MAAKRKTKAREAQLAFEAIFIEGGLLSPEWLSKVAQLQAGAQSEADYRIPKGLNLRDEIGRYWRVAQAHWSDFERALHADADRKAVAERFVLGLLRDVFGFTSLEAVEPAVLQERTYPIGHAALGGRAPVVVAPAATGLDTLSPAFGDGSRRRSAFGLAQEHLNAEDAALWGVVTDGVSLRIVRDNASLTRPAWIEADLQRIFTEERYADFAALWLLVHESRFGRPTTAGQPAQAVSECALEVWRNAGREEGTRAREHLRRGVEEALVALGQGFVGHPDNAALRAELQSGKLSVKDYFNQLLRLVYRLIFLLTVEERGLLHPEGTSDAIKALYADGYGLRRLRERSVKRSAHDRFSDLWDAVQVVFRGVSTGEPRLGLPALAGIFSATQCPALDRSKLENRALLLAVFKLAWLRADGSLARVNWRDMGPEELGSVYESLLELVPQIGDGGREFRFATGGETKGNARKTSGSYYTPDSLVQVLLDSALEPVIHDTIAKNPTNTVEALLGLSIVDPACGSGHFLLAAARRLAGHVARLQANGTPSAAEYRHALRQVVGRCIFGVDLNPMAVELCKVGLWMEAVEPGLPLTFLDSHIQHGNALLGTTPELMANGIPDKAWDPIEGDDKKAASALKKRNKKHSVEEQMAMSFVVPTTQNETQVVSRAVADLDAASDADVEALAMKEARWGGILGSREYRHQKFVADAWCAAFVWPKQAGPLSDAAPTNELWRQIRDGQGTAPELTGKTVVELAEEYRFFHWHLQFPQVFARGGFDVVLGNPPWERVKLQEKEWFASRLPEIGSSAPAERKRKIANLVRTNPEVLADFHGAQRATEGQSHFLRASNRFPLGSRGDINTYGVFSELGFHIRRSRGRAGLIVPSGLATDDTYKELFGELMRTRSLVSFFDFENRLALFPGVDSRMKFSLITMGALQPQETSKFAFFLTNTTELRDAFRVLQLSTEDIALVNPSSHTAPIFRSRRDADIALDVYKRIPVFRGHKEADFHWRPRLHQLFHMTSDAQLFSTSSGAEQAYLPVYEGKMIDAYDHRAASIEHKPANALRQQQPVPSTERDHRDPSWRPTSYLFGRESDVQARLPNEWPYRWFVGLKRVTSSTNERTLIGAIIPWSAVSYTLYVLVAHPISAPLSACLLANLNALVCDFFVRQKTAQPSLPAGCIYESPVIPPQAYATRPPWTEGVTVSEWVTRRVLELSFVSNDLEPFARDVGWSGPPFSWNNNRRASLRAELDAAFFHLYGVSRSDAEHMLDSFTTLRKNDEREHGAFVTKSLVLSAYDAMSSHKR